MLVSMNRSLHHLMIQGRTFSFFRNVQTSSFSEKLSCLWNSDGVTIRNGEKMTGPSTKKLTFSRYIWFIDQIKNQRNFPNARSLAEKFEISKVQAQRDIDFMRDRLDAPLEYKHSERGYVLTDRSYSLPTVWIEESELLLLAVAKELFHDGDARKVLVSLLEKILLINSQVEIEAISELISYKGTGCYRHPKGILSQLIPILLVGKWARIKYCPVFGESTQPVELSVEPRHLLFYKANWYLVPVGSLQRQFEHLLFIPHQSSRGRRSLLFSLRSEGPAGPNRTGIWHFRHRS